jgi:Zn-dependent protease with chaperone function
MTTLEGRYFLPRSSRFVEARASASGGSLRIADASGTRLDEALLGKVRVSRRLGRLVRRIGFPSGGRFDAADNDAVDDLLREARMRVHGAVIDRLERSWRAAGIAAVLAVLAAWAAITFGIPETAKVLADATPDEANRVIAEQTIRILDGGVLQPSKLPATDEAKARLIFARVTRFGKRGPTGYHLIIREGGDLVGPNAFALPDGTVIMTDEMWALIRTDDEIEGVFAHELSHIDRRHNLQMLYRAALVPAAIAVVTGDVSQVSQIATLLPGLLLQAAYSRTLEQEADDDAALTLRRMGADPAALGALLRRMDAALCQRNACPPSWIGSHPDTEARAQHLRNFPYLTGEPRTPPPSIVTAAPMSLPKKPQ